MQWQVYDRLYGLRDKQSDLQNALLCQLTANLHRGEAKPAYRLEDFSVLKDAPAPQAADEIDNNLRVLFAPMLKK